MHLPNRAATSLLYMAALAGLCPAQEWTESSVVQKFLEQSPYAREARARAAIAQAEAKGRSLYANPSFNYSREGAGLTEFFDASDTTHIVLSGSNVSGWTDKVGGITVSQAIAANQPTYSTTSLNGYPGIACNGTSTQLCDRLRLQARHSPCSQRPRTLPKSCPGPSLKSASSLPPPYSTRTISTPPKLSVPSRPPGLHYCASK